MKQVFEKGESIEFSGKIIVDMAKDPNIHKLTSKIIIAADYAQAKGIKDLNNREITSIRQIKGLVENYAPPSIQWTSAYIPGFLKIPQFVLDILNSKF